MVRRSFFGFVYFSSTRGGGRRLVENSTIFFLTLPLVLRIKKLSPDPFWHLALIIQDVLKELYFVEANTFCQKQMQKEACKIVVIYA